jgi:hypothetical protein
VPTTGAEIRPESDRESRKKPALALIFNACIESVLNVGNDHADDARSKRMRRFFIISFTIG